MVDLNLELLGVLAPLMGVDAGAVGISDEYVAAAPGDLDMRGKKALRRGEGAFMREYTQVFHDRTPFVAGLSAVDLLFCEGPGAGEFSTYR